MLGNGGGTGMSDSTKIGRLFWAVPLDDEVRRALSDHLRAELGRQGVPGRAPRPESWHLTLRFLGDVTASQHETMVNGWRRRRPGEPFQVTFGGLGAFPTPVRASVLWIGLTDQSDGLSRLAHLAEETAVEAGFAPERRGFHPHLTLSRLRPPQDLRRAIEKFTPLSLAMNVEQVVLYRSHLGSQGARYEALERFLLGE